MSGKASLLPLSEELYLRSLTGRLVGEHLFDGYRKVAVITYPDRICAGMATAALTSFTYYSGYKDGVGVVYTYDENIGETAKKVSSSDFEVVYISYGGEQKLSTVNEAAIKTFRALMEAGYKKALAIHVRVWIATKQLSTILSDDKIRRWLEEFFFNRVKIVDGKPALTPYREVLLTDEHVDLLKRSIPPPE